MSKNVGGFLTSELRIASYVLRVTIYYTSYQLFLTYELRVTISCKSKPVEIGGLGGLQPPRFLAKLTF